MTTTAANPETATESAHSADDSQPTRLSSDDPRNAARIAYRLTRRDLTPGHIAVLKRMDPEQPTSETFWKVCHQLGIHNASNQMIRSWALICRIIAAGTKVSQEDTQGPHDGGVSLGQALAQTGYTEQRFKTLLDAVLIFAERAAAYLHTKGQRYNVNDVARLVLTRHRQPEACHQDRFNLARNYYHQIYIQANARN